MSAMSSPAVTMENGEITISADLLAQKLGLSVEALKTEMRRGCVYSLSEHGIAEDAGRSRLTFRYRNRTWIVVVERDGTLIETQAASPRPIDEVTLRKPKGHVLVLDRRAKKPTADLHTTVTEASSGYPALTPERATKEWY
jgi:hypothetical protein